MSEFVARFARPGERSVFVGAVALAAVAAVALVFSPKMVIAAVVMLAAAAALVCVPDRPEYGLVLLVPAAALDVTGRLAKVAGVTLTLYQALAALLAVVLVWRWRTHRLVPAASPLDVPVVAFLLFALASVPAAVATKPALVAWVSLASSAFLLFAVVEIVDTPAKARLVVWAVLLTAAGLGVLGVAERFHIFAVQGSFLVKWGTGVRARTTFGDPNIFGTFEMAALALGIPVVLAERRWLGRLVGAAAVFAALGGLWSTYSRGAWLAFLIALAVLLVVVRMPAALRLALVTVAVLGVMLAVTVVIDADWIQRNVIDVGQNVSAMSRVYMARSALQMWLDHPLGVGLGNYPRVYPLYRTAFVRASLVESHTAYLTLLAETGLLGLGAFLWVLWRFFRRVMPATVRITDRVSQAVAGGALAAVIGITAQSFTYSLEASKFLWLCLGLGTVAYVRLASGDERKEAM